MYLVLSSIGTTNDKWGRVFEPNVRKYRKLPSMMK